MSKCLLWKCLEHLGEFYSFQPSETISFVFGTWFTLNSLIFNPSCKAGEKSLTTIQGLQTGTMPQKSFYYLVLVTGMTCVLCLLHFFPRRTMLKDQHSADAFKPSHALVRPHPAYQWFQVVKWLQRKAVRQLGCIVQWHQRKQQQQGDDFLYRDVLLLWRGHRENYGATKLAAACLKNSRQILSRTDYWQWWFQVVSQHLQNNRLNVGHMWDTVSSRVSPVKQV